ncbi:helix-turn-helix transcriptional regulator [Flavilitoribacter nigricans]|uniref:HTH araC/xylS-type domain-containing protein n=1 Tax=Flavilitoribacter nigricans (strain ATCC 23147 / DSM 23189 / NBRC 102662 / NCIMB 1420 / SS-2) TaxID=1122177 RepID=A0A2D0N1E6_FLAN2|nr:AraC family transcriptional regulator [Flavilitoribacter nigricans]PHN02196.1 hypothetical protein CRP01_33210 [Flavilitoribacter nigricans DSM 23189 = NBRC 102662]
MLNLNISSLPMQQVLHDLAVGLNTEVTQICNCYTVRLPERVGSGFVQGVQFPFGFALLNYQCLFYQDTVIRFDLDQVHPMKFLHCFDGHFTHCFAQSNNTHEVDRFQNIGVASKRTQGHVLHFPAKVNTGICSVEMDRAKFQQKTACLANMESSALTEALVDAQAHRQFYRKGNYSVQVSEIIQLIKAVEFRDLASGLYLEGKSYEILSLYWQQFSDLLATKLDYPNISKIEYDHLREITTFIAENIRTGPTLGKVEQALRLKEKYVQKLFKKALNTTFAQYLKEYRLKKSAELLQTSDLNVSQIVYALGLSNRSYFTKIFKEKFGITPTDYKAEP